MPKKAPKKSKEEKLAENLFPIDKTSLKHSIEKEYKPLASETIIETEEKPKTNYRKKDGRATSQERITKSNLKNSRPLGHPSLGSGVGSRVGTAPKKRKSSKKKTLKKFTTPKINLKKGGYELIITEKPQAAGKIAAALGDATKQDSNGAPYYELTKNRKKLIVACTVGHLLTLKQNISGYSVPIFDIDWVPNSFVKKSDFTKKYYNALSKLAKDAGSITVATDYDVEGEVIGLNAVRFICGQKDANRMKFSTLTPVELNKAYKNKTKTLNWGQAIAGETRHYLDWFYGINLSRALMNAIKSTGKFRIMSIGRIQGPTLNLIVQKEREIQKFKPETYWQVFITIKNSHILELKHNKDIFNKSELEKFEKLNGQTVQAKTTKKEQIIPPNTPFNLTTLQMESYKFHGLTPAQTLRIAQSLYLSGFISYPRTSSQQLPESIDYKSILKKLAKKYHVEHLTKKQKPIQGKKSDPAHPPIYPTGQSPSALSSDEEKIYNLIVKRFLALFCEDAIIDNKTISVTTEGLRFTTKGSSIRKKAWMEIYPTKLKEQELPDIEGEVKIINVRTEEKQTQPPRRYTAASIVSELEKRNLGTKATRANIIETLYNRNYIKEKSIETTPLGMSLISTLEKYSPIIINEELTRNLEKETEDIANTNGVGEDFGSDNNSSAPKALTGGREGDSQTKVRVAVGTSKINKELLEKEKKVIDQAKKTITQISEHFNKSENKIGNELLDANMKLREQEREANKLTTCPVCGKGELAITYSRKTRKNFVACNAYPDCKTTFSLPPNSLIKKTDKVCDKCGFPMLMSLKKGKRPWFFCFNDKCESNRERIEEYKKKKKIEEEKSEKAEEKEEKN